MVSAGGQCRPYTVDLCDRQAIYAAAAKVKQEVGKVSRLVRTLTQQRVGKVSGSNRMPSSVGKYVLPLKGGFEAITRKQHEIGLFNRPLF